MVNNENSFILINQEITTLPYLECIKFIVKASYGLIENGESQFIDFIHANELITNNIQYNQIDNLIEQFDFYQGTPVARQFLAISMLTNLYYEANEIIDKIKKNLIEKTKINLNRISDKPSLPLKISRAFSLLENKKKLQAEILPYEEIMNQFLNRLEKQKNSKKEELNAPLNFWEEESIRKSFYQIISFIECSLYSFSYITNMKDNKIISSLISIKEDIFASSIREIYNKTHFILRLIKLILKNNKNIEKSEENLNKEQENSSYTNRLSIQLSKLNENISEIKKLEQKMIELNTSHIKFREMIDEEIHSLNISISKENIVKARLEMRLNDDEYPLSVAFRTHITKLLQYLEE
ncbi:hypothetical protein [Fluviispira sanaruensis]|uniref:hypothetical protein n=1 Tax=Fluviispira sanaruensis TaxID=2493639 RepID=UPI00102EB9A2|nr:hypothetical protein [Fluviispira sanaruensis]